MKHVVALSGGKDSVAMALRLMEVEPRDYEFMRNETGNELPEMKAHWRKLERMLGKKMTVVKARQNLEQMILTTGDVPNVFTRWCTRKLKIKPTVDYMRALPEGSTLYVGLRADEASRPGLYDEDLTADFPMRRWGWDEAAVWNYLRERGVGIPERTDCAWCPYQRLGEWKALKVKHPVLWMKAVNIEKTTGFTFRSPGRDTWPTDLEALGAEFDTDRHIRAYNRGSTCRVCSL